MKNKSLKSLVTPVIIYVAFIFLHASFEKNAADIGFSWTSAAIIPYMLVAVAALLLGKQLGWVLGGLHPLKRKIIGVISFFVLGGVAFGVHPIYEGDFSNTYDELVVASADDSFIPEGFSMVALPGCPFCKERITTLNNFASSFSLLPLHVIVVADHEETLTFYQTKLSPKVKVIISDKGKFLSELVGGIFPSFIYNKGNKILKWHNNGFGVQAWDWLAEQDEALSSLLD